MKSIWRRLFFSFLCTLFLLLMSQAISYSQEPEQKYPRGAQYYLGTDDQLLIKVNIWGFVAKPGQYLVPSDTDLISLISFAGGPRDGSRLSNIKLIRAEKSSNGKNKIIKINVNKFIETGQESLIPRLQPGDTIIVSGSTWYHVNDFLGFITKIATLIQIYWWVIYYSSR